MVLSVVRDHHWPPEVIGKLYLDAADYRGLRFWYNDAKALEKELKKKK